MSGVHGDYDGRSVVVGDKDCVRMEVAETVHELGEVFTEVLGEWMLNDTGREGMVFECGRVEAKSGAVYGVRLERVKGADCDKCLY